MYFSLIQILLIWILILRNSQIIELSVIFVLIDEFKAGKSSSFSKMQLPVSAVKFVLNYKFGDQKCKGIILQYMNEIYFCV